MNKQYFLQKDTLNDLILTAFRVIYVRTENRRVV
nr:MAG TPA: hypothetical protein [Caudoviricetes sp.]